MDVVDAKTRSRMMSGIRGKDTKLELVIRSGLHRRGLRYRLHDKHLPGKPDLVLRSKSAVVFVHGCFWHGHNCHLFRWPSTRAEWWHNKIKGNRTRDARARKSLKSMGWRQAYVWECSLKGRRGLGTDEVIEILVRWLKSDKKELEISSRPV